MRGHNCYTCVFFWLNFQVLQQQLIKAERERILQQAKSGDLEPGVKLPKLRLSGGDEDDEEEDEDDLQVRVRRVKKGL